MALAEVKDLEKAYAGKSVLRGISFDLQKGQRIGLVGPNGAGKTTLLKLLAGVEQIDQGSLTIAKSARLAYVSQVPRLDPEETLRHQVTLVFEELHEAERQLHEAAEMLAKHADGPDHDKWMQRYGDLEHHFQTMGGYDTERRVESVLDQLGFAARDLDLPIKALSGGQKSRAQIARLLLEGPDIMLLDEPTNHMDLKMLDWLEDTLNEGEGMNDVAMVIVSHDRYFLDSVVDQIWDMQGGRIEKYPGNYSAFVDLKAERQLAQNRSYDQQQAYIAKQEEYIRRFGAGQRAKQARGRKIRLDRLKAGGGEQGLIKTMSLVGAVRREGRKMILNLEVQKPSGIDVLKAEELTKSFPEKKLFENLDLHVLRGRRVGIIGPNGSGKTTLLNTLFGEMKADHGAIKWGHGVVLQYYRQEHQDLDLKNNVLEELQKSRITATQQELRDLSALFLFSGDTIEKKLEVLSGGEKSRVAMAKLLLNPTNTILMDEPTNHLDMQTCEVLEKALDSYDGTLILVSHDRFFMDQVCDNLLVLQGDGGWKMYAGSYTDYLAAVAKEKTAALTAKRDAEKAERHHAAQREAANRAREKAARDKQAAQSSAAKKVPFKFQKMTVKEIEVQIMNAEHEVAEIEASFGDPKVASNASAMQVLQGKYKSKKNDLAELNRIWELKIETTE
jgi:ATP-binding cassette, subfamily F, member 3